MFIMCGILYLEKSLGTIEPSNHESENVIRLLGLKKVCLC